MKATVLLSANGGRTTAAYQIGRELVTLVKRHRVDLAYRQLIPQESVVDLHLPDRSHPLALSRNQSTASIAGCFPCCARLRARPATSRLRAGPVDWRNVSVDSRTCSTSSFGAPR